MGFVLRKKKEKGKGKRRCLNIIMQGKWEELGEGLIEERMILVYAHVN